MSRLFIRGDTHADFNWVEYFCRMNNTTTEDFIVILGDAGINYYGKKKERLLKEALAKFPITFLCLHGNHEARPTDRSMTHEIRNRGTFCGEVYYEPQYDNIWYFTDGEECKINDKIIMPIGGAYSVDKYYRLAQGWTWFENEQLTDEEMRSIEREVAGKHYDIVLTHTCPFLWQPTDLFLRGLDQRTVDTTMECWLQRISDIFTFDHWYFGHYHADREDVCGDGKVTMLFNGWREIK